MIKILKEIRKRDNVSEHIINKRCIFGMIIE